MRFELLNTCGSSLARSGRLTTDHGAVETPAFMTVGTQGTVKGVHQYELKSIVKAPIVLANTYHLYLRPGLEVLKEAGGIHRFMGWDRPVLTDSGGFQIFSLAQHCKINENGAVFKSHIDGSRHEFSPERAIDIQRIIGADIIMAFDECLAANATELQAETSMHLTHRWLNRCFEQFNKTPDVYSHKQSLFPIVQGGMYEHLRKASAHYVQQFDSEGYAIGGLSVGEPAEKMYAITQSVTQILPKHKPRYLMGVGTPENILECISLGIDLFDCVLPARNARHGLLYTYQGVIHIRNEKWKYDTSPLDANDLESPLSHYSKAYLRHLFAADERLGPQIASLHNLRFYQRLLSDARSHIQKGNFLSWKTETLRHLQVKL